MTFKKNNTQIETERLILRKPELSDAESIAKNANDIEVSKWLLVVPNPYTLKDAISWIKSFDDPKEGYSFTIELKSEKCIIGGMGLHKIDLEKKRADVGYWIGSNYHRKGYGSEALAAIIDFAFNKLELKVLEAGVFEGNPSSGKMLEKFGFKIVGESKTVTCKADGRRVQDIPYKLFKKDYRFQKTV